LGGHGNKQSKELNGGSNGDHGGGLGARARKDGMGGDMRRPSSQWREAAPPASA
jgi:hypothetical protein